MSDSDLPAGPTGLIHHPYQAPEGFNAPQPGVFKASTVFFPTVADMRQREWKDKSAYTYGRPTPMGPTKHWPRVS